MKLDKFGGLKSQIYVCGWFNLEKKFKIQSGFGPNCFYKSTSKYI
jgi:hypothetical protein